MANLQASKNNISALSDKRLKYLLNIIAVDCPQHALVSGGMWAARNVSVTARMKGSNSHSKVFLELVSKKSGIEPNRALLLNSNDKSYIVTLT